MQIMMAHAESTIILILEASNEIAYKPLNVGSQHGDPSNGYFLFYCTALSSVYFDANNNYASK
jgi:hypothetical protein